MQYISVAVGVIQNSNKEILLTQRPHHVHQAGKWEFPGGKVEAHEIPRQALNRELFEEIGIEVQRALPLIRIHHDYGNKQVILDVWQVTEYTGEPFGREGQALCWVPINELLHYEFPAANYPIITALQLPRHYVLTSALTENQLQQQITQVLQKGYRLIRFRAQGWKESEYLQLVPGINKLCLQNNAELIIDGNLEWLKQFSAAGLHLTCKQLFDYSQCPIEKDKWLAASCHNEVELLQAAKLDVDFALLSPVLPTTSHPEVYPLGWPKFSELVNKANFPVYALGGMSLNSPAIWFGAQGISGLRVFSHL